MKYRITLSLSQLRFNKDLLNINNKKNNNKNNVVKNERKKYILKIITLKLEIIVRNKNRFKKHFSVIY